jgi:hypothetical protein
MLLVVVIVVAISASTTVLLAGAFGVIMSNIIICIRWFIFVSSNIING